MFYTKWLTTIALVLFPLLALTVQGAANVFFYLLLLSGLMGIGRRCIYGGEKFSQLWRAYWPLSLAMGGILCAILINHIASGHFVGRTYDAPFRLALFPCLLWALLQLPVSRMKQLQWSLIGGAFYSAINMYLITKAGTIREHLGYFIPLIAFSEMSLLLGVFSVISIGWNDRNEKALIILKLLAGCAGLYGAYLSQSRGAWIAVPAFIVLAFFLSKTLRIIHKVVLSVSLIILLGGVFYSGGIARDRIEAAKNDISQYEGKNNSDTSLGIRFQLWYGSWVLFNENPMLGVSRERFPGALQELSKRQIISPTAATLPHSHNEILYNMATLGLFGWCAIVALYLIPGYYFLREIGDPDVMVRSAAGMGLSLCLGYFIFGLADVMFMWGICNTFYVVSVAVFFAFILKRKEELLVLSSSSDD